MAPSMKKLLGKLNTIGSKIKIDAYGNRKKLIEYNLIMLIETDFGFEESLNA